MQDSEDLYGETPTAPESPASDGDGKGADDQKTFVVPEEVCPGMKPGDQMQARVLRVNEGSYEMSYEPSEKEETPPAEEPAPDEGSMASMMQ
jgi:hypothetical protein